MLSISAADSQSPLGERLLVAAVGPLITVLVGGLVVWGVTSWVQRRREEADRLREEKRADSIREEDLRSSDDALRQELVQKMTETAGSWYLMTQHYWRAKDDVKKAPCDQELATALRELRPQLDARYLESRTAGVVLESQLDGYFVSSEPRRRWHQVTDLLTVRYFQLIDRANENLYGDNAGLDHSGLKVEELRVPKILLRTYHGAVKEAVRSVFEGQLRSRSSDGKRQSSAG
jgi:hypothetical protein